MSSSRQVQSTERRHDRASTVNTDKLWNRGFVALLATQFLVALNDNIFRWLIIPIGKDLVGQQYEDVARTVGSLCFLIPFIVWVAVVGYFTDKFSKRRVMIGCKIAEIMIMIMGIGAILHGNFYLMLLVLFLMGTQSAFFSPSKYGSIPELVPAEKISRANGHIVMTTMAAVILGAVLGNYLYEWTTPHGEAALDSPSRPGTYRWWISAVVLIGVAVVGWLTSLFLPKMQAANCEVRFPVNPLGRSMQDLKMLYSRKALFLVAMGSAYFWGLGALAQLNIDKFATEQLLVAQKDVGPLLAILTIGIGLGAVLAGWWSKGKIELGLVGIGGLGIVVFSVFLGLTPTPHASKAVSTIADPQAAKSIFTFPYLMSSGWLLLMGMASGLFDIPLVSYLQDQSPREIRGRVLAGYNFLSFTFMSVAMGVMYLLAQTLGLSAGMIWIVTGLATLPVVLYIVSKTLVPFLKLLVRAFLTVVYRPRIMGVENIPAEGGVLLVCNHVSWIDGLFVYVFADRPVRYFAHADYLHHPLVNRLANETGVIRVEPGKRSVIRSVRDGRTALKNGEVVCIFPEGGITRTGQIKEFEPGFLSLLKGTEAQVVPVYLGGLFGSMFSYAHGKRLRMRPRKLSRRVTVAFGEPMTPPFSRHEVKQKLESMGVDVMKTSDKQPPIPQRQMLRMCRRNLRRLKLADSLGTEWTGGTLLLRSLILRRLLRRGVLEPDEKRVGILLPSAAVGVVANAAVALDGRTAVDLNYTFNSDILNYCCAEAGVRHILTSRKFMERFDFQLDAELVYLEDFADKVTFGDKLIGALHTYITPVCLLEKCLGLNRIQYSDELTIIFTSGSTGKPKGAVLTHENIAENINGFLQVLPIRRDDVLLGVLPFFHSFGFTVTVWLPLVHDNRCVYHVTPLEPKRIGSLARKYGVTAIPSTPTFLRSYLKKCAREDFARTDAVIGGAEKFPPSLFDAWEKKFGHRPVEGYGTTELSPVVGVNVPASRQHDDFQPSSKEGSIGRPLPNMAVKVVDPETGEGLPANQAGMLMVKGPCVMKEYLNQPERTAEVLQDGWYRTGDIAEIDEQGFITITGRLTRISKIGGEMVPHVLVEEAIHRIALSGEETERQMFAVAAVRTRKKAKNSSFCIRKSRCPPMRSARNWLPRGSLRSGFPHRPPFDRSRKSGFGDRKTRH